MTSITKSDAWIALVNHHKTIKSAQMRDLFNEDSNRFNDNHIQYDDLLIDYSKNRINENTIPLLTELAREAKLDIWRDKLFSGEKINFSEDRSALHTALRNKSNTPVISNGKDVMPEINASIDKMGNFSESIRSGKWKGFTGKRIESIVNIGILPIFMGFTMWLQQKLNPAPADPTQAKIFALLPFVFTFVLAGFAAGLVLYWSVNNILSIAQQWFIQRKILAKNG